MSLSYKYRLLLIGFFATLGLYASLALSADTNSQREAENTANGRQPYDLPDNDSTEHIKYFGYFGSSATNDENQLGIDSTPEVADHVNLVWVSEKNLVSRFESVRLANQQGADLKVVFSPYWTLFEKGLHLHPDHQAKWQKLALQLDPFKDLIVAFYPIDEPYARGKKLTRPAMDHAEVNKLLRYIAATIKNSFPETPLWSIFAHTQVHSDMHVPDVFQAVGVDCYGGFKSCGRFYNRKSIPLLYAILEKSISRTTKLLVVPDGFVKSQQGTAISDNIQQQLISNTDDYFRYSRNNTRVIGFIPFLWQNHKRKKKGYVVGIKNMPLLRDHLKKIAQQAID